MCLLVLAWNAHPGYRLILAANRDELHERPAAPLAKWSDAEILAGRDLSAGGTWLGFDRQRRFGIVTNFREWPPTSALGPSRGRLIPDYLCGKVPPRDFLDDLKLRAASYAGFNLLLGDGEELCYASNRAPGFARALQPGVYGLSNRLLDTAWPKLTRVRQRFEIWLRGAGAAEPQELLSMLNDREPGEARDAAHPADVPPEWRRALSAPFVLHPVYGTRCSTVVQLKASGALRMIERRFDAAGACSGETAVELHAGDW